jgi:DNA-binding MarR family transcriptional regulator
MTEHPNVTWARHVFAGPTKLAMQALQAGPKTNAALQDALATDGATVASLMARLKKQGRVERSIERDGRRNVATYALKEQL